ncbi:MAG: gspK [Firmicutes bacterium]|nr:gspK [Bacillota bacterium]
MRWIMGVDGGGTKTVACAADLSGKVLGRVEQGAANYHVLGLANFTKRMSELIAALAQTAQVDPAELVVMSLGLAGVDRVGDRQKILAALRDLMLPCDFVVNNDACVALAAGAGAGAAGIVLIAGTGSIAYGINSRGEVTRAGGLGHILGDEGSGYDIGRQALVRSLKAAERRDKPTVLLDRAMVRLKVTDIAGLISQIYNPAMTKDKVAALAEIVAEARLDGDVVADEIIQEAGVALTGLVQSVLERGGFTASPVLVCLYGGVLRNIPAVRQTIASILGSEVELVSSDQEPVMGALKIGHAMISRLER